MKTIIKYILILVILIIIFIILIFYNSKENILEDIIILGLWNNDKAQSEFEVFTQNAVEIDVFATNYNKVYKKIAPGSKGGFVIKFKRPIDSNYKIRIIEKTSKPQNLVFIIHNKKYSSLKQMENIINQEFKNVEKITINWEWEYYIDDNCDIQDTRDGEKAQRYLFEILAIIEERKEI